MAEKVAELVKLARDAAHKQQGEYLHTGMILVVFDDGRPHVAGANLKKRPCELMRAKITPAMVPPGVQTANRGFRFQGVASEEALTRALLASAIEYAGPFPMEFGRAHLAFEAWLANSRHFFGSHIEHARDALLESLLSEAPSDA